MILSDFNKLQFCIKRRLFRSMRLKLRIEDSKYIYVKSFIFNLPSMSIDILHSTEYILNLISLELLKYNIVEDEHEVSNIKLSSYTKAQITIIDKITPVGLIKIKKTGLVYKLLSFLKII